MSRWGSHNKNSKMTNTNNFVPWKHGPIVATELSRGQLCKIYLTLLSLVFEWILVLLFRFLRYLFKLCFQHMTSFYIVFLGWGIEVYLHHNCSRGNFCVFINLRYFIQILCCGGSRVVGINMTQIWNMFNKKEKYW